MVVLTVVMPSNEYTVYFDQPISKPNYVRLLSCSLYNSGHNLKRNGLFNADDTAATSIKLTPGHYSLATIAKDLSDAFTSGSFELSTEINTSVGQLIIRNPKNRKISLDRDLAQLFGINRKLLYIKFIKRLTSPTAYYIHCDLVDQHQNLLNGKPPTLLAKFDIKGKPFEKVYYETEKHVLRDASSGEYVNSVTLSVKDLNGELFDFNGLPLEFELEIN